MSRLRAKCPDCGTFTAVALGPEYECHSCGRTFGAGLLRVPRAWGKGGEAMEAGALIPFDLPEVATVREPSIADQNLAIAAELPERPLVLGGCCCAHIGAVEGLASRHDRMAVVWLDAHGDLNTIESSPSGNLWATPLRTLIDAGTVKPDNVALVGARNLDPPEEEFIAKTGVQVGDDAVARATDGCSCVYVAFDTDSVDPNDFSPFMPEPGGLTLDEVEALFGELRERTTILGAGFTAFLPDTENVKPLHRLARTLLL